MHDQLFDAELIRFGFLLGIVVSMIAYERFHLSTGSVIVPGYLAVFILQPLVLVATFANASIAYFLVNKVLTRFKVLYGRDRFTVTAVISILIQILMLRASSSAQYFWGSDVPVLVGAGYIVPAMIAHDFGRHGFRKTLPTVLGSAIVVGIPLLLVALVVPSPAVARPVGFETLAIDPTWVPLAILLSTAASWAMLRNHGLRMGGFVGAAFVGMLGTSIPRLVFILAISTITWLLVDVGLRRGSILFGRRKFAAMMIVAALLTWAAINLGSIVGVSTFAYTSFAALSLTPLFVPGLIANDMERSSPWRVLGGVTLGVLFVVPITWGVQEFFGERYLPWIGMLFLVGGLAAVIVFWGQLVGLVRPPRVAERRPTTVDGGVASFEPVDVLAADPWITHGYTTSSFGS